jgi:hypothetical protein
MLMAAGSRGDAAVYAGFATALVLFYAFRPHRRYWLLVLLPLAMGIVALWFLLQAGQAGTATAGFTTPAGEGAGDGAEGPTRLAGIGLLAYNFLNVPSLWAGVLGTWGLGWLDTDMPSIVGFGAIGAFVAAGYLALRWMQPRVVILVGITVLVLWALPLFVLQQGGQSVGEMLQPRYLLPLVVLLGGLLALGAPECVWTRPRLYAVAASLVVAHSVALHANLHRYLTGIDAGSFNLNADIEWWWSVPFSPMIVWFVGSGAYAALLFLLAVKMPLAAKPLGPRSGVALL